MVEHSKFGHRDSEFFVSFENNTGIDGVCSSSRLDLPIRCSVENLGYRYEPPVVLVLAGSNRCWMTRCVPMIIHHLSQLGQLQPMRVNDEVGIVARRTSVFNSGSRQTKERTWHPDTSFSHVNPDMYGSA